MAFGIIPSRDWKGWTQQRVALASANSALKGSLCKLDTARNLAEYTSVDSQYLGVIMHRSVDSLPTGQAIVAIPSQGARAMIDVPTGIAASALSLGQAYGITRFGTDPQPCSYLTTLATSVWSRVVEITGTIDSSSGVSRIEVAFIQIGQTFGSTSSTSLA